MVGLIHLVLGSVAGATEQKIIAFVGTLVVLVPPLQRNEVLFGGQDMTPHC